MNDLGQRVYYNTFPKIKLTTKIIDWIRANSVVMSTVVMFPSSVESPEFVGQPSDFHVLKNNFSS
jgi:hypothetical protein